MDTAHMSMSELLHAAIDRLPDTPSLHEVDRAARSVAVRERYYREAGVASDPMVKAAVVADVISQHIAEPRGRKIPPVDLPSEHRPSVLFAAQMQVSTTDEVWARIDRDDPDVDRWVWNQLESQTAVRMKPSTAAFAPLMNPPEHSALSADTHPHRSTTSAVLARRSSRGL